MLLLTYGPAVAFMLILTWLLIPFSLELRDITQETEYVMNFWPMWLECAFESLTEVIDRGEQICNRLFAGNTVIKIVELNQVDSGINSYGLW